jgi:transketolase
VLARQTHTAENLCARGGYILHDPASAKITLLATGTEMALALGARDLLAAEGIAARIVSLPCWALFEQQPEKYRRMVLGSLPKVAIEAASPFGWDRYIGDPLSGSGGAFLGMQGFGASGPAKDVYTHFGITAEAAADLARNLIRNG